MKIPYWFMNYEDFEYLFEPSAGTQAPILKKALGLSKISTKKNDEPKEKIHITFFNQLIELKNLLELNNKELLSYIYNRVESLKESFTKKYPEHTNICKILNDIYLIKLKLEEHYGIKIKANEKIDIEMISESYDSLVIEIENLINCNSILVDSNIDIPKYFDFKKLISSDLDRALEELGENNSRNKDYLSGLKMRLSGFSGDLRKAEPLMFDSKEYQLLNYLEYIFGLKITNSNNPFSLFKKEKVNNKNKNQIIILDLSLLPFELLETITGLIGRLILEFTQRINKVEKYKDKRGEYPIALILEEAQNYIPEVDKNGKKSITKKVFERIAREGRKFGVSLIVSSQRPSELSKTILSQCNTFIVHKLQNPEDQRYIRQIVSSANEELLNQLPILPQQHAIIMGEAVRTPSQVRINDITKKPDSNNPKFIEQWLKEENEIEIKPVTDKWLDIDEKDKNNEENRENE